VIAKAPHFWKHRSLAARALLPLSLLFRGIVALRRLAYRNGLLPRYHVGVPTIVVGNISVGGTGKTPLVLWLACLFRDSGLKVGIVSRGYGAPAHPQPQFVRPHSDPGEVGDEAVLLAQRGGCPVVVHADRVLAARALANGEKPDLILSDDGLQHYRLARDLEIALVDGEIRFGNGLLLPAGPLREPPKRLRDVDMVVCSGGVPRAGEVAMTLSGSEAVSLDQDGDRLALSVFRGAKVHAVAGIANPRRFFEHLRRFGLLLEEHPFPDHHAFRRSDLVFGDGASILMTEKDAVKCRCWPLANAWYVPVQAMLPDSFGSALNQWLTTVSKDPSFN